MFIGYTKKILIDCTNRILLIAKIYKKMYIRNLPFRVIVPVCYQMRLNVVFSGLSDNKKNKLYG